MTPNYSILYVCSYISRCKKKYLKVVYRQVFCKCVRLMQCVLYYSTTSNWSVCKSVYIYIILATTTRFMNYTRVIYKYYPTLFLFYSLHSDMSSSQLISNYSLQIQICLFSAVGCVKVCTFRLCHMI